MYKSAPTEVAPNKRGLVRTYWSNRYVHDLCRTVDWYGLSGQISLYRKTFCSNNNNCFQMIEILGKMFISTGIFSYQSTFGSNNKKMVPNNWNSGNKVFLYRLSGQISLNHNIFCPDNKKLFQNSGKRCLFLTNYPVLVWEYILYGCLA